MANIFKKVNEFIFGAEEDDELLEDTEPSVPTKEGSDFSFTSGKRSKVVKINTTAQLNVVIVAPSSYEECKEIADHLKTKRTVVINLEGMSKEDAHRMVDFISGAVYACDGNIQKVSSGIILIAPYNVGIMGDIRDELKSTGLFNY